MRGMTAQRYAWPDAKPIFCLKINPAKRAKRTSFERRFFDRVLVGKKLVLDAAGQSFTYGQPRHAGSVCSVEQPRRAKMLLFSFLFEIVVILQSNFLGDVFHV
ncbi:hypothetical protein [uncultured Mitsuokella sp.]|uniref:hypothetical protein n=1 Tax=uncultured Mitsuokella sp. TaxID=453120 RepID=UPI00266F8033|nr:hypothetical protein [uncultured Mitsuokella sp.]